MAKPETTVADVMHPVGPLTPKVYWVRRVAATVLAVAVLIGMVWFLATRSSRSAAVSDAAVTVAGSAAPTLTGELAASTAISPVPTHSSALSGSVSPSASGSGSPAAGSATGSGIASSPAEASAAASAPAAAAAPAASEPAAAAPAATPEATAATPEAPAAAPPPAPVPPPPSYDAQGKLLCADADVSVTAAPSAPAFAVGDQPRLLLTVTNIGTQVCQRDVSGSLQTFTVFGADGSRIFSTADCFPGTGSEVRELTPGQQLQYTIKWSGTTSAPGCTGERVAIPAGDYTVIGQLGGLSSSPAPFTVTG